MGILVAGAFGVGIVFCVTVMVWVVCCNMFCAGVPWGGLAEGVVVEARAYTAYELGAGVAVVLVGTFSIVLLPDSGVLAADIFSGIIFAILGAILGVILGIILGVVVSGVVVLGTIAGVII